MREKRREIMQQERTTAQQHARIAETGKEEQCYETETVRAGMTKMEVIGTRLE